VNTDRAAGAWIDLQNLQDPMGLYARMYRAKVVAQSDDAETVDVRPDDPTLPDMANIPLRHGVPGARVSVAMGSYVLVGWDDGRPDHPFAGLWNRDSHVLKVSFLADRLNLGDRSATEAYVQGTSYRAAEDIMLTGLQEGLTSMQGACQGALAPLQASVTACLQAVVAFRGQASAANGFLSTGVFGK
jgi:hypothetical protein